MQTDGQDYRPEEIVDMIKQRTGYEELKGKDKADMGSLLDFLFRSLLDH
jgi:hypothetical protein